MYHHTDWIIVLSLRRDVVVCLFCIFKLLQETLFFHYDITSNAIKVLRSWKYLQFEITFHAFYIHIKDNDNNIGYYTFVLIESSSSTTFFVCDKKKKLADYKKCVTWLYLASALATDWTIMLYQRMSRAECIK